MEASTDPARLLESIRAGRGLSGKRLVEAFNALPRVSAVRSAPEFDDSTELLPHLYELAVGGHAKVGRPSRPTRPGPRPGPTPGEQTTYHVRVHAVLAANDDGTGGAANPNAVDGPYLEQLIAATNTIYQSVGVEFSFDPATDFERVNSSLLNLDFTVPATLNFAAPETQPPLTTTEVDALAAAHANERQRVGREHRHKMVLLFCDGNMLVYDKDQSRWTIIDRTYAFSSGDAEFVALPTGKGDLQGFANLVAHETGHYFHQWHTHGWAPANEEEAAAIIKSAVEGGQFSADNGAMVFDADASQVTDTPPDAGNTLFDHIDGQQGCGVQSTVTIPVTFADGTQRDYAITPDRADVMSYFKHCLNFAMHFSPGQAAGMRRSMEEENRWHLIHPSMRLHTLGVYVTGADHSYCAVWKESEKPEVQVYDWAYGDVRAKYDELWPQGWRLKILSPYVVNDQVRYAAVWGPGTEGEIQVYDWAYSDVRAKYDELWPQGWRLKILSPYVVNDQVRYAAVWGPGTEGEIQVYDWAYSDVRAKYDELWPQGWRLKILSPYVVNDQVRYAAVWRPSTEGEIQVYDWAYSDVRAKYDELWPQGWRLKILSPYVVNDQVRYAAVWRPSTEGEIQVYDWAYEDLRALYDRMW
jgi:hypothetical protein